MQLKLHLDFRLTFRLDFLVLNVLADICVSLFGLLLYLYRARNKITQLSIPTHEQLQRHRLKLIKNHIKTPTCFGLRPSSGFTMSSLKSLLF